MSPLYLQHIVLLERCALFTGIAPEKLLVLLGCLGANEGHFRRGEMMLRVGQPVNSVGVLVAGSAHVIQEDYWGNRAILTRVEPGELFAESFCCARTERLPVSVLALEDSAALFLDFNRIINICTNACDFHNTLIKNMLQVLAQKSVVLTRKLEDVTQRTTRDKLLSYLSQRALEAASSSFSIPFNRQQLADYLAVDRSALSAELSRMQNAGLLRYRKNHFELPSKGRR